MTAFPLMVDVGAWVEDKHRALQTYLNLHAGPRAGFTHRTDIDVFCGSGRAQVRDTRQLVDGSPIAARKCSQRKARLRPPRGRVPRSEISAPASVGPPGSSPPKPVFDLNRQNPGNIPEFHQVIGLHRTRQYADQRERRAVMKAKRAAGCGDLTDATSCVVRDRDRDIDSAHCVAPALGFRTVGRASIRRVATVLHAHVLSVP
jgi:hypothetical protein